MSVIQQAREWGVIMRANTVLFERPDRVPRAVAALLPYGRSALGSIASACARYPDAAALITGEERLTYRQLWKSSTCLARGLRATGINEDSRIGILCRNNPLFVQTMVAGSMIGADLVFLNTGMAGPQLREVIAAEQLDLVVHDSEFTALLLDGDCAAIDAPRARTMIAESSSEYLEAPPRNSRFVVLTSGTTGRPRGAIRQAEGNISGVAALLARIPMRARDTVVVPAPFFHAWGLGNLLISLTLSGTVVTRPRFDPETLLIDIASHRANTLVVVPAMLQQLCDLEPVVMDHNDCRSLRVIAAGGSLLPSRVVVETLRRFGPVLYNIYGSTEVSTATVALPSDLITSPTTAGRPAPGVRVEVVDVNGDPVPTGETGRILVGNRDRMVSYTGGSDKDVIRGLVVTGDLGHFDKRGRLYVDGREDDMIVSGGENVYPVEVEELLGQHEAVAEVAVIGVADDRFGQSLKAFVVLKEGSSADVESLRLFVKERLAHYKVPRSVELLDELPRNATGKVLRRLLK